jgi:hypothetical protein
MGFGVGTEYWRTLAVALLGQARESDVVGEEETFFGIRYSIEGAMKTPDGRNPGLRSIWFLEQGEQSPLFVTASPVERR